MDWAVTCDFNTLRFPASKPVIWAIDDNEDNLLLLSYSLESLDCVVLCETDSQAAYPLIQANPPDLILLDILLPGLNGFDFIRKLKLDSQLNQIPVIAVTALVGDENQQRIIEAGFADYISKPYILDDLLAIVRKYIRVDFHN